MSAVKIIYYNQPGGGTLRTTYTPVDTDSDLVSFSGSVWCNQEGQICGLKLMCGEEEVLRTELYFNQSGVHMALPAVTTPYQFPFALNNPESEDPIVEPVGLSVVPYGEGVQFDENDRVHLVIAP